MSKNFIIAKAMLAGLGGYAVAVCLSRYVMYIGVGNPWVVWLNILIDLAVIFAFICFFVFGNDWLAGWVTGDYEGEEDFDRSAYLIKSFRISFVIIGLCLLCTGRTIEFIVNLARLFHLPSIRLWIQNMIETGRLDLSFTTPGSIVASVKLLLIAYLICGGKYIINWHLGKIKNQNVKIKMTD